MIYLIDRISYGGVSNPDNYSEVTCDTAADIADLPTNKDVGKYKNLDTCSIGSKATVISDRTMYILNGDNQWVLLKDYKATGGGSSILIDETLTESGQAADAKAVGDKIAEVKESAHTHSNMQALMEITDADITALHSTFPQKIYEIEQSLSDYADTKEEVTQARVDANGTTYSTLKERLDSTDENVESVSTELKEDLDDISNTMDERTDKGGEYSFIDTDLITFTSPNRMYWKGKGETCIALTSSQFSHTFEFDVKPLEKYRIVTTLDRDDLKAILFVDDNYNGVSYVQDGTSESAIYTLDVTVPFGATKCVVNTGNNTQPNTGTKTRNLVKKYILDDIATEKYVNSRISEINQDVTINQTVYHTTFSGNNIYEWLNVNNLLSMTTQLSRPYNTAKNRQEMSDSTVSLMQEGDVFQHDSTITVDTINRYIYVACLVNDTDTEDSANSPHAYIRLSVLSYDSSFNIDSSSLVTYRILGNGDSIDGGIITKGCGSPNVVIHSDGNIYVLFNSVVDDNVVNLYAIYNPSSRSIVDTGVLKLNNVKMYKNNWKEATGFIDEIGAIPMNGRIAYLNGVYYATLTCSNQTINNYQYGVLINSSDLINWNVVKRLEMDFGDYIGHPLWEASMGTDGKYLFVAIRQYQQDNGISVVPLVLARMDTYGNVLDSVLLPSCSSKPDFFRKGTYLILCMSTNNRVNSELVILPRYGEPLRNSRCVQTLSVGNYVSIYPVTTEFQFISYTNGTTGCRVCGAHNLHYSYDDAISNMIAN